jgi:carbon-monoxide dehydrogenase medium subunit
VRGTAGTRWVPIDDFLVDSFATAVGEGEVAVAARFPIPTTARQGRIRRSSAKSGTRHGGCGRAARVERRRRHSGGGHRAVGRGTGALRVDEAERLLVGQKPSADAIRAAADAASRRSEPQADLRGTIEYKKHLAGVLVARGLRHALARLGVQA